MAFLKNEESLCSVCKFRKTCDGVNDSEEAKVVYCPEWEKDINGSEKDRRDRRPGAGKRL